MNKETFYKSNNVKKIKEKKFLSFKVGHPRITLIVSWRLGGVKVGAASISNFLNKQ